MNCEEIIQKVKDNWTNKSQKEKDILTEKIKQTKLERYGNENYNNGKSISETKSARTQEQIDEEIRKSKQTKLERYCDENYQNYEKGIETKLKRYGVKSFTNSEKAMRTKIKNNTVINKINYKYNNLEFASSWELYYYIYQKEILHNNIQKGKIFEYKYNGNKHFYYCDFLVNNENVEIKGSQLLDESNNLKQMKTREWDMCKQKCMEQNNVKIISKEEIKPIIKIVKNKFGNKFIEQFKLK